MNKRYAIVKKNNTSNYSFLGLTITINNCFTFLITPLMFSNSQCWRQLIVFWFCYGRICVRLFSKKKIEKTREINSAKKITYLLKWFNRKVFWTSSFQWRWFLKSDSAIFSCQVWKQDFFKIWRDNKSACGLYLSLQPLYLSILFEFVFLSNMYLL